MFEYSQYELQKKKHKPEFVRNEFKTAGKYRSPIVSAIKEYKTKAP